MSDEIKLTDIANQEEFIGNAEAVKIFGTWDNYNAIKEIFSVKNATPQNTQSNPYDAYMKTATDVYNKGIEQNNNASANQAAAAGAEYRELNRNVNEINKANGRANTGYAGDTSIDGYNAYRNSLNEIYSQRDKANNDLYSYYMNSMMQIQQAKDNKEASDRDYEFQAKLEADTVLEKALSLIPEENAYDSAGNLKGEHADRIMNYFVDYYGGSENIPNTTMSELNTYPGWKEYLNAYNTPGLNAKNYTINKDFASSGLSYSEYKQNLELAKTKGEISEPEYNKKQLELNQYTTQNNATWKIAGLGTGSGLWDDSIDVTIDESKYNLKTKIIDFDDGLNKKLNTIATGDENQTPSLDWDSGVGNWGGHNNSKQPGKLIVYNGNMYIYVLAGSQDDVEGKGSWQQVVDRKDKVSDCVEAYINSSINNNRINK